jgi:hypothetical protein
LANSWLPSAEGGHIRELPRGELNSLGGSAVPTTELQPRCLDVWFGCADDDAADHKQARNEVAADFPHFFGELVTAKGNLPVLVSRVGELLLFLSHIVPGSLLHDSQHLHGAGYEFFIELFVIALQVGEFEGQDVFVFVDLS